MVITACGNGKVDVNFALVNTQDQELHMANNNAWLNKRNQERSAKRSDELDDKHILELANRCFHTVGLIAVFHIHGHEGHRLSDLAVQGM